MKTVVPRKLRLARAAIPVAATALLASACSSAHGATHSAAAPDAATHGKPAAVTVKVINGPLGSYLADGSGRTLYVFGADTESTSNCTGSCPTFWPPFIAGGEARASSGASAKDIATTNRSDGANQVTYAGHPLYYYSGDSAAGQTEGEGINEFGGLWTVVAPSGQPIDGAASGTQSATGGYGGGGNY